MYDLTMKEKFELECYLGFTNRQPRGTSGHYQWRISLKVRIRKLKLQCNYLQILKPNNSELMTRLQQTR